MDLPNTKIATNIPKIKQGKSLNNKWDKYLNDYNNYFKEYMKQYGKSLSGNLVSLSKYPYMKAKSLDLYQLLVDAKNKSYLTEKQIKRITKIQMRILANCKIMK